MTGESATAFSEGNKLSFHVKGLQNTVPVYYDYYSPAPIVAMVRFGKWNDILALPLPDEKYYLSAATHHFARGMAFLRISRIEDAQSELATLEAINKLDTLKTIYAFFNANSQITDIATKLLKGEILVAQKKTAEGLQQLEAAVMAEDDLRYNEPSDWRLPARHYLGAALIGAGKRDDARKVYEADLVINPGNGWSLKGLSNCGVETSKRFASAWTKADVTISSSRF
jgi:tetratricopeptide (TPR) repeat protein